jgi:hypothetical protein
MATSPTWYARDSCRDSAGQKRAPAAAASAAGATHHHSSDVSGAHFQASATTSPTVTAAPARGRVYNRVDDAAHGTEILDRQNPGAAKE